MNCQNCGQANAADATSCAHCGAALPVMPPAPPMSAAPPAPPPGTPAQAAPPSGGYAPQYPPQAPATPIPNHLVWAILATICCCLPTGIVSIIYAAQVDGKVSAGDFAGARQASDNAKLWAWVSLGLGLVGGAAYFGLGLLGAIADAGNY